MPKDSESIVISTGPIPGSQKVYVEHGDLRIPFREVALEESANEPPVRLYDTSGPYTDANFAPAVDEGLPRLREEWIRARGDVVEYDGRTLRPEDNHREAGDPNAFPDFPNLRKPLRAKPAAMSARCIMRGRALLRRKWNSSHIARISAAPSSMATAKRSARIFRNS